MKSFYIAFMSLILAPLLVFDLLFDNKQELFMELNYKIIFSTLMIAVIWMIGYYLISKRYRVTQK